MHDYGSCFNIAHIELSSEIYGPGKRFVIWLQGCSLACPGCWNKIMWNFTPRIIIQREVLLEEILANPELEGVTFLGGEPLQQSENLYWLMLALNKKNISIMLYTGYEIEDICNTKIFSNICNLADILIAGRYREEERDLFLRWRGSRNQLLLIQTNRYCDLEILDGINEIEIKIDEFGSVTLLGYPTDCILPEFSSFK
ncbi:MAG: 4Fe-4S single cluster domain-containing protein [Methanosarcinales archaeon]|nr:4Fe-4S single cluster domain-containing protein [Methanosarcinales archaeon]